jgi:hypothetical protein
VASRRKAHGLRRSRQRSRGRIPDAVRLRSARRRRIADRALRVGARNEMAGSELRRRSRRPGFRPAAMAI